MHEMKAFKFLILWYRPIFDKIYIVKKKRGKHFFLGRLPTFENSVKLPFLFIDNVKSMEKKTKFFMNANCGITKKLIKII